MEFSRIGEHTIKCVISEEEIYDLGYTMDEIMSNGERTQEFMNQIFVATDAFSESISPTIGIEAVISQFSFTSLLTPSPSLPITRPIGPVRFKSYMVVPPISAHTNHMPFSLSSFIVFEILVTLATGV